MSEVDKHTITAVTQYSLEGSKVRVATGIDSLIAGVTSQLHELIADTQEAAIKAALIELGWSPPGAFRALVERVCDPAVEGCSEYTIALEERARIRAALLASL